MGTMLGVGGWVALVVLVLAVVGALSLVGVVGFVVALLVKHARRPVGDRLELAPDPYGIAVAIGSIRGRLANGERRLSLRSGCGGMGLEDPGVRELVLQAFRGEGWAVTEDSGGMEAVFAREYDMGDLLAALALSPPGSGRGKRGRR